MDGSDGSDDTHVRHKLNVRVCQSRRVVRGIGVSVHKDDIVDTEEDGEERVRGRPEVARVAVVR